MNVITKEAFLKQKINNFSIFIAEKIGKDNQIYRDFTMYAQDINAFLQAIISLRQLGSAIDETLVKKYLEVKGVKKELEPKDLAKINAYFTMFVRVINS